jgi:hypothetical protein
MARIVRTKVPGLVAQGPLKQSPDMGMAMKRNLGLPYRLLTAVAVSYLSQALTGRDQVVGVDATAAAFRVDLPAAETGGITTNNFTAYYDVYKSDASGNAVTIRRAGSDTINGGTSDLSIATQWTGYRVICVADGQWHAYAIG